MADQSGKIRIGVAGVGLISMQSHIPAVLSLPDMTLAALIDPSLDRARKVAANYGIAPVIAPALDDAVGELDALIVATPNDSHRQLACAALEAGVHVLIEKPLASTAADGQAIVDAAERHNRVAAVGYVTRFRDNLMTLASLLGQHYFGRVRAYAYQFGTPGGWASLSAYILSREATGGGVTMVTGTHFIDRALHLFGSARVSRYVDDGEKGPEANSRIWLEHPSDDDVIRGVARFSKTASLPAVLVIETDRGKILLEDYDDTDVIWQPKDRTDVQHVVRIPGEALFDSRMDVFQRQLRNFADACRGSARVMVSARDGLASLRLIEEMYQKREALVEDYYPHNPVELPA